MRIRYIFFLLGALIGCIGLSFLVPIVVSLGYGESETVGDISQAFLLSALLSAFLLYTCRPQGEKPSLSNREGIAVVGLFWLAMCMVGALPMIMATNMTWTACFFESASGFTTTGATILPDIEALPKGLLFWRSFSHWLGGMGIIVLSLAVLPFLGAGGMQLFKAETTGPTKDKLAPRMRDTARYLWGVYALLTGVLTVLLWLEGMSPFDAINHAMSTIATGGFSTRNASIAAFPNPVLQWTLTLFMLLAGMQFALHYMALQGKFDVYRKNSECMLYCGSLLVGGLIIAALLFNQEQGFEPSLRNAFFQLVSLCTSTGFITENYLLWPFLSQGILFLFILMGACAGSTGGGIKVMRVLILIRMALVELRRVIHPRSVERVKVDGRTVQPEILSSVMAFFLLYCFFNIMGALVLMGMGHDLITSVTAVSTCLSNTGPGFGAVGPVDNFAFFSGPAQLLLSLLMILGRLEIYTIFVLFLPTFWRS